MKTFKLFKLFKVFKLFKILFTVSSYQLFAHLKVYFKDLAVNLELQVTKGKVKAITVPYDLEKLSFFATDYFLDY